MFFKKTKSEKWLKAINKDKLPGHIAIIMDGNGRWAKRRGLPRTAGHHEGGKTLLKTVKLCNELGIKAVTVYAFSTENWKRPKEEVDFLMSLPSKYIQKYLPQIKELNIKMNFIGQLEDLPQELKQNIDIAIDETKDNTGTIFTIALNYGAYEEILTTTKQIAAEVLSGQVTLDGINQTYFESKLMTYPLEPVDLMIRTSGEIRISNYLLWQIAYSELYFTSKYWPDFNESELYKALWEYQNRNRRFGGLEGE
jgi:undecaprenyl diphosphate synthase